MCSGCRLCEVVCSFHHEKIFAPWLSRIRVFKKEPAIDYPVSCKKCKNPPCLKSCEFSALSVDPSSGGVVVNEKMCTGCGECTKGCPFGAIYLPDGRNFPVVCDLCGGDPKCVKFCPAGVLRFMTSDELARIKQQKIALDHMGTFLEKWGLAPKEELSPVEAMLSGEFKL
jgi:Fe-S-cluster-containing hydrogenase component 2